MRSSPTPDEAQKKTPNRGAGHLLTKPVLSLWEGGDLGLKFDNGDIVPLPPSRVKDETRSHEGDSRVGKLPVESGLGHGA